MCAYFTDARCVAVVSNFELHPHVAQRVPPANGKVVLRVADVGSVTGLNVLPTERIGGAHVEGVEGVVNLLTRCNRPTRVGAWWHVLGFRRRGTVEHYGHACCGKRVWCTNPRIRYLRCSRWNMPPGRLQEGSERTSSTVLTARSTVRKMFPTDDHSVFAKRRVARIMRKRWSQTPSLTRKNSAHMRRKNSAHLFMIAPGLSVLTCLSLCDWERCVTDL